jgi:hypothetical protein
VFARWTYINGWPVTSLAAQAALGQATAQVLDTTGIYASTTLQFYDDTAGNESQVVASTPSTSTITFASNLTITHAAATPVTALPPAVKEAAILLTSALIRTRGNEALVMDSVQGSVHRTKDSGQSFDANVGIAIDLLQPYRVIR